MNDCTTTADNAGTQSPVPQGYERREVIWPGTEERISVLMPVPTGRLYD